MSIDLSVLASGSSGNCSLVRTPSGLMLIDAGIGPRAAARRMTGLGVVAADIRCICLTHLDSDHFTPSWLNTIIEKGIQLFCPREQVGDVLRHARRAEKLAEIKPLLRPFDSEVFHPMADVRCTATRVAHDQQGSYAFQIDCQGRRLAYATDLGHVPASLNAFFHGASILAIESNYDPDMQLQSGRPERLKERIMGGAGHLSNRQAFESVQAVFRHTLQAHGRDQLPRHVVLLHRSRQCNCTTIIHRLFSSDPLIGPRVTLAHPYQRTEWLQSMTHAPAACEQLCLF